MMACSVTRIQPGRGHMAAYAMRLRCGLFPMAVPRKPRRL